MPPYPKHLIEVDLPTKTISAHVLRAKSIRHRPHRPELAKSPGQVSSYRKSGLASI
jgi:hypothetical protein